MTARAGWALLAFVLLLVAALCWRAEQRSAVGGGLLRRGAPRPRPSPATSPNLVVDTLNLVHWRGATPSTETIVRTIRETAPILKKRHSGRIVYVLKDRESAFTEPEALDAYAGVGRECRVDVAVAERHRDPPGGVPPSAEHSARGRDDFYTALLAAQLRCAVLTADRLRDFALFRGTLQPFYVTELRYAQARPARVPVRPEARAHIRLRKPRTVHPSEYFA